MPQFTITKITKYYILILLYKQILNICCKSCFLQLNLDIYQNKSMTISESYETYTIFLNYLNITYES
jgi:hypothetical protein